MKKLALVITVLIMLSCCLHVYAMDSDTAPGEVLYHQDFGAVSDFSLCGIKIGTAGTDKPLINIKNNSLDIASEDNDRLYLILPQIDKDTSYTAEFEFRFVQKDNDNAYVGFILTCRGDEPTNITALIIRADGSVDDFTSPSDEIKAAIKNGEEIEVTIPLSDGVLHEVELKSGDKSCIIERKDVILVGAGFNGFVVRNAEIAISDVYIINGTDYYEKIGYYAEKSYSDEAQNAFAPEDEDDEELAPATEDLYCYILIFACTSCAAAKYLKKTTV